MIEVGKGGARDLQDYHLSRFACYLIAQNGDSRKSEIANAQMGDEAHQGQPDDQEQP